MIEKQKISFITAVNDDEVLNSNLLPSPDLKQGSHEVLEMRNFKNATEAYNKGIEKAKNDLLVFIHQDVYLPSGWGEKLINIIKDIEKSDKNWGVLGCFGVTTDGLYKGHVYSNGLQKELGGTLKPILAQSLDELILIFRKSTGLLFDPKLPGFHMYGTQICITARKQNFANYIIDNFCIHNSISTIMLKKDFWDSVEYIRNTYREYLPVKALCSELYSSNLKMKLYLIKYKLAIRIKLFKYIFGSNLRKNILYRLTDPSIIKPIEN